MPAIMQAPFKLSQPLGTCLFSIVIVSAGQRVQLIPMGLENQHKIPLCELLGPCTDSPLCVFVLSLGLGYRGYRAQTEERTDRSQSLGASTGGFSKLSVQRIVPNHQGETRGSCKP